ncbi:MAG TPA: 2-C-methyl-D-erythritol 4-phosphate cytidylyltransferase [Terrimesophilobacter sp.]|uniref:2-C-methyl-D-erythritol 4-phosphate cytidylyltransferase n=1 Tax=Terrimesophilobacter sp. TaxID=2906435 RepID=UPI002F9257BD
MRTPSVAVIVVAAGSGDRLGRPAPKAFVEIAGRTILERALDGVFGMSSIPQVIVVVPADRVEETRLLTEGTSARIVAGGATRQRSVAAGLSALADGVQTVLVHDAARALTPASLLDAVAAEAARTGHGVIPGLPVADTVKQTDDSGRVAADIDRSRLRAVQTPQGFPRELLVAAYASAGEDYTDDAALFTAAGHPVSFIGGDPLAFKITTPWDLQRAEQLVTLTAVPSVGLGIDVHAFDPTRPLWLGALYWPDEPGLAGHSDGDALSHAICDALLSAAGLGDLGSRFGTDDPRFAGAHGEVFLAAALRLVADAGFSVGNISVQLVGNRPRLGPRRSELEARLRSLVGAPVSVSATTSDGLGFTGTGEGVAVIATALLRR